MITFCFCSIFCEFVISIPLYIMTMCLPCTTFYFFRSGRDGTQESSDSIAAAADKISRLSVNEDVDVQPQSTTTQPILEVPECRCGMPLCICKAPTPEPTPLKVWNYYATSMFCLLPFVLCSISLISLLQMPSPVPSTVQSNPRPKKVISTQHATYSSSKNMSSSNNKHRSVC